MLWLLLFVPVLSHSRESSSAQVVMGRVSAVHRESVLHVGVRTSDGAVVWVTADDQTRYLRGTATATARDVCAGARITVSVRREGKTLRALEVRLNEPSAGRVHD